MNGYASWAFTEKFNKWNSQCEPPKTAWWKQRARCAASQIHRDHGRRATGQYRPGCVQDAKHAKANRETPLRVIPSPGKIPGMEGCADWLCFVAPEDAGMSGCLRALRWLPRRPLAANPPPSWLSSALSLGASCGGSAKHSQPTEHKREISDSFFRGTKGHG